MSTYLPVPPMSPAERADLEREAGRKFGSDEEAYNFRIRKINRQLVSELLERKCT